MFGRRSSDPAALAARLDALEKELATVRREASEVRAAHGDAIELAIAAAVPTSMLKIVEDARATNWTVTYRRHEHRDAHGRICFEHPENPAHNCSVEFPLPTDADSRREIEGEMRMRIGWVAVA